jgi:D-alanyl-D-alanine carboxypeptidase
VRAYLVLRDHSLPPGQDGPAITLTDADVADTERRRGRQESVVSGAAGEQLTERQALQGVLLRSANNIAAVLARWDAGSVDRFVARERAAARSLGTTHVRHTDPSGYDDATVSTAAGQVRIVDEAIHVPVFASILAAPSATLPVAGTGHKTNRLLGYHEVVGVKTGATAAAGGCFAVGAIRWIDGKRRTITGSCWASPVTTRSRRVSRPSPPWSTASPVIQGAKYGLCRIYGDEPCHHDELLREVVDDGCTRGGEPLSTRSPHTGRDVNRTLRPLAALAMVAMVAVISAGCSHTPAESGTGSSGGNTAATATTASATATAVTTAPAGQTRRQSTGQQLSRAQKQAWLGWAKCIRAHGVPKFADPTFPADVPGAVALSGAFRRASGPRGRAPIASSPQLQSAMDACKMPSTRGVGG